MGNHIDQENNWQKGIILGPMFPVGSMFPVPSHAFTERVSFSLPMDSRSEVLPLHPHDIPPFYGIQGFTNLCTKRGLTLL